MPSKKADKTAARRTKLAAFASPGTDQFALELSETR